MRRVYCFHMGRKERGFMSQNVTKKLLNIITILVGNAIYALGVVIFILPNDLITGGTTGLGLAFEHYFHVPLSAFVFCFNAVMFILGALVLGKMFAFSTLISSFFYPIILGVFQKIPELSQITQDKMLSTVCGGLMIGFAIGIVIRAGASTGGMDIPPLVLNKKFGLPVSVMLYVFDFAILISQMFFSDKEQIIYGILLVLIYTVVLDKVLLTGHVQTQVKIISKKYKEINEMIVGRLDRGSTILYGETGYLHTDQPIILTVISNRELARLNQEVTSIDPEAFMIIARVNEVKGHGFSSSKIYKNTKGRTLRMSSLI